MRSLQVGIRLSQHELTDFVNQLDIDGGGKIEVEEVTSLLSPPSLTNHLPHTLTLSPWPSRSLLPSLFSVTRQRVEHKNMLHYVDMGLMRTDDRLLEQLLDRSISVNTLLVGCKSWGFGIMTNAAL